MSSGRRSKYSPMRWAFVRSPIAFLTVVAGVFAVGAGVPGAFLGGSLKTPEASFGYLRRPLEGKKFAYQTMLAEQRPDHPRRKFCIRAANGDLLEFGLIRIGSEFAEPVDYTFAVRAKTKTRSTTIFETSGPLGMNSWELFRTECAIGGKKAEDIELEYSLEPKGWREEIDCIVARAMGRPYWKDFAFIAPTVIHKRKPAEMNVMLVVLDSLRADRLGCLGYANPTSPNIDAFARENILFTRAVSASPWTLPAHFSLFTGLYPSAELGDFHGWGTRCYAKKYMANLLKQRGYFTVAIGSLPHASGFGEGFDLFRKYNYTKTAKKSCTTRRIFDDAMNWIAENRETRFFMLLHNYECHIPYESTQFLDDIKGGGLAPTRNALYDGDVRTVDAFFGELIERLESLDLLSNTVIIVTSDHGEHFYDHFAEKDRMPPLTDVVPEISGIDHGHSVYQELIRVPIIFHLPDFKPAKTVFDNHARLIDVLPTLLDFLDIEYDGPMQGESLVGLMLQGDRPADPAAISEFTYSGPEQKSIILDGYKYIFTESPDEKKCGVGYRNIPVHALYDLSIDPGEKHNIYDENKELAERLHLKLKMTMLESREINNRLEAKQSAKQSQTAALPQDVIDALNAFGYLKK